MNKSKSKVLFKPQPLHGFERSRVLYIPMDAPSKIIGKALKKRAVKATTTPLGQVFLLKETAVIHLVVGAPTAVIWLERFVASGAKELLILGFCGSLKSETNIADPILITKALSEEGTSRHYFPRRRIFRPSTSLQSEVRQTLRTRKLPCIEGSVVSTDAPFRETESWLEKNRKKGIGFVDMEASAVFALAEFHGIKPAALMLVTDKLTANKHKIHFKHPDLTKNIQKYFFPFME
ncbi:MAG: nucleoside phosphorylase [Candidatus Aminicenantes bacterium]|nr:nucleoside phosphorylase [Candidatus Aminicenantes bacterium]